jgi:hypothetical protein
VVQLQILAFPWRPWRFKTETSPSADGLSFNI